MFHNQKNNWLFSFMLTFLLLMTTQGYTRNGFIPHYVGTHGLTGGAGMAFPQDASNVITNPAALMALPNHIIAMAGILHQNQYLDSSKAMAGNPIGQQKNGYKDVLIGTFGLNYRLNNKLAIGLGVSGGGGFVKFKAPVSIPQYTPGYNNQASNNIVLTSPTVSYALTPDKYIGFGLLIGYSGFKTNLAKTDGTLANGHLDKDTAFGAGARIGGLWKINPQFSFGTSISTPVFFRQHKKYLDIFSTPMQIPATFLAGFAWHATPKTNFVFDYKEIFYGACRWLRNGQGWRNQTVFLAGVQHQWSNTLTMGIGYNYGAVPLNKDKVLINSLSIPFDEHNISGGARYKVTDKLEVVGVAFFSPKKRMVDNGGGGGGGGAGIPPVVARGTVIESKAYGLEVGIKYNF